MRNYGLLYCACACACLAGVGGFQQQQLVVPLAAALSSKSARAGLSRASQPESVAAAEGVAAGEDRTRWDDEPTPSTFSQCIQQAYQASERAIADGFKLLEVEFPPVSADALEDSMSSAYDISRANVRLASSFGDAFAKQGKKVAIILPDKAERERAIEDTGSDMPYPGVTIHSVSENAVDAATSFDSLISGLFNKGGGEVTPIEDADMYVAIVFSCQEIPDLQKLHELEPEKPLVLFNLKLDTQRGDMGLPAFPPKDAHYKFLAKVKPAYLLRTRSYSKSMAKAPYIVNYQGAQYRVYPGKYQSLLDVGKARYRQVGKTARRLSLGEFKDVLGESLKIDAEKGNAISSFFRKGYKQRTWWEDENNWENEASDNWRT